MWRPLSLNPALEITEPDPVCEERREQKTLFPESSVRLQGWDQLWRTTKGRWKG